jgi:hypothetical protein
MGDTNFIGNSCEAEVLCYLTKLNITVSLPFCGNERYDQIWDINGKLLRIQVKKSNLSEDKSAIVFSTKSSSKYTSDEIDGFATYYNGKVYYVPIENAGRNDIKLRFNCPPNSQLKQIKFAYDYELENILQINEIS